MATAFVVGLTTAIEPKVPSLWNDGAALVRLPYLGQVASGGGLSVLLPPSPCATADPDAVLDRV